MFKSQQTTGMPFLEPLFDPSPLFLWVYILIVAFGYYIWYTRISPSLALSLRSPWHLGPCLRWRSIPHHYLRPTAATESPGCPAAQISQPPRLRPIGHRSNRPRPPQAHQRAQRHASSWYWQPALSRRHRSKPWLVPLRVARRAHAPCDPSSVLRHHLRGHQGPRCC